VKPDQFGDKLWACHFCGLWVANIGVVIRHGSTEKEADPHHAWLDDEH